MSSLNSLYIKTETLKTLFQTLDKKDEKGIEITLSINDEVNDYDQNISAYVSQSKEEREAKKPRFYIGNGKTFWTDGKITVAKKKETHNAVPLETPPIPEGDDLPF